jgi:putative polyhydroxyalkanoate system protein
VLDAMPELRARLAASRGLYGMISVRLQVATSGAPGASEILFNNIVSSKHDAAAIQTATAAILEHLQQLRFAPASAASTVTVPVLLPIPPLEPIRVEVTHELGLERARGAIGELVDYLRFHSGLDGTWDGDVFRTICPGAGFIELTERALRAEIETGMVLPLQAQLIKKRLEELFHKPSEPIARFKSAPILR